MFLLRTNRILLLALLLAMLVAVPVPAFAGFTATIGAAIFGITIAIGGFFAWIGGMILDFAIYYTVIDVGNQFLGSIGVMVDGLWQVVRDIFNMLFIFVLIYIGLRIILKSDDSGTRRNLGLLIVAALLINFSLFITKTIVDFTNLAAYQVYEQLLARDYAGDDLGIEDFRSFAESDVSSFARDRDSASISGAFMETMRLSSFANQESPDFGENLGRVVVFGLGMMIFMIMAGLAFAAGGFLLIARFIALIIFMIFSPMMFLGWIYPGFKRYADMWWNKFLGNAFVAPAYLFMLLLSLLVVESTSIAGSQQATFAQLFATGDSSTVGMSASLVLFFFIAIGFLYASVLVAKQMGAAGAGAAMKIVDTGRNNLQALAYRNTAGRGFNQVRGLWDRLDRSAENGSRSAQFTRALLGGEETRRSIEKARNYGAGGQGRADLEQDAGTRSQRATRANRITDVKAKLNSTNPTEVQQGFADMSNAQLLEIAKTSDGRALLKKNAHLMSGSQVKAINDSDLNDAQKSEIAGARSTAVQEKITSGALKIKDATKDQLGALGVDELSKPENAIELTEDKIKNLDLIDPYKDQIKKARKDAYIKVVRENTPVGSKTLNTLTTGMSADDIASLPDEVFAGSTPAEIANVKTLLASIPFRAYTRIADKKGGSVQANIRSILNSMRNPASAVPFEREVDDWLDHDPVGRRFGVN